MNMKHAELVGLAKKWLERSHGNKFACGVVLAEYRCYVREIPDVIGLNAQRSIVLECKVSRADFLADRKKGHRCERRSLGNYRYYLTLPDVACAEDVDNGWGLLHFDGRRVIEVKKSEWFGGDEVKAAEWALLYSVARRVNLRGLLAMVQKPLDVKNGGSR